MTGIVIVNEHEPHHEVAARLLELADEKGYEARTVEAQRGEHDAALSFRVPQDVADAFNDEREDRWPAKIKDADEDARPVAAMNEDAVAADSTRSATDAATTAAQADEQNTEHGRRTRPGKAQTAQNDKG